MEFYQKLRHNVQRLKEKAEGLCKAQQKEREMLTEKLKPKGIHPKHTKKIFFIYIIHK